ncbi:MAG: transcription termination/antitermination protein NusG [Anaerolineaceae bacterium]
MNRKKEDSVRTHWYVIHSHVNKEDSLRGQLELKGINYFYPTLQVKPINPRSRKTRPYFPGYFFVSLDLTETSPSDLQWMPYSVGLVSFGGEPARVPENLIQALKKKLVNLEQDSKLPIELLKQGDAVVIKSGPFDGFEGIFQTHLSGKERVQVLLKMLSNQSVPLDLPDWQVAAKKK